ncbi:MAG: class I SAM-dependent methyltransferase [Carboxydocellales bacterium]
MPWYYDLFDYVGEEYFTVLNKDILRKAKKEVEIIKNALALQPEHEILDLCCGIGRHTIPLVKSGFQVIGLDASPRLLQAANRKAQEEGLKVEFIQGDMRELPFQDKFNVVLNLWSSFGYLENEEEHLKAMKSITRVLKPGGKLLLDVLNRDWVVHNFQSGEEQREFGGIVEINNYQFDSATGRDVIKTKYIVKGEIRKFTHSCRIYTLQELQMVLEKAGLMVIKVYGGFNLRPVSLASKQLLIIAEKPVKNGDSSGVN